GDPGVNISLRGGFAEAHTTPSASNSQAGIASGAGSGAAFASKNFSYQQQSQVLNAIQQIDDTLLTPVNTLIDQLAPALKNNGINLPHLTGPPPTGLIDIADLGAATSSAQTSTSPGFVSATSSSAVGDVKLLAGWIELHGVKAGADSESNSGTDSRSASATVGHADAAAQSVAAPVIPPPPGGNFPPPLVGPTTAPGPNIVPPVNQPPTLVPPTPGTTGPSSNFNYRRPGADVARALHTVYLIFFVGGLMSSLLYPMFVKRAPHLRRRPLLV